MDPESHTFHETIKVTKRLLEQKTGKTKSPLDLPACLEFIKGSIGFLNASSSTTQSQKTCLPDGVREWYPIFVNVLHLLYDHRKKTDFNLELILSYLNHIVVHLIKVIGVPVEWFRLVGLANLEFLAMYRRISSYKIDFLSALVQKSYQCMRVCAQREDKESKGSTQSKGEHYILLVMGCAYLTLDTSTEQDVLSSCKSYISNFLQLFSSGSNEKSGSVKDVDDVTKEIFLLGCVVYCLHPWSAQTEQDACFFKDLYRLVQHNPQLRDQLVQSGGNLLSVVNKDDLKGFSISETKQLMETSSEEFLEDRTTNEAFEFMMSICQVLHLLMQASQVMTVVTLESKLKTEMDKSVSYIHTIVSDHPSPSTKLPQHVGEILTLLSNTQGIVSFERLSLATAAQLHNLLSLSMDVLARDILCGVGTKGTPLSSAVASTVSQRSYSMAVINKSRLALLQSLISHNNLDKSVHVVVAGRLKGSLNLLCILAQRIKKGSSLSPESSAYRTIFKTLKSAVGAVGTLCRQLKRSEKYDAIVSLAGPLWPVANLPDMLSSVTHHESLCEAYRVQGDLMKACQVVVHASALSGQLITSTLLKTFLKVAKVETTLKIPFLFSKCPEVEGVAIMMTLVRLMTVYYSSSTNILNHLVIILKHLLSSGHSLSPSETIFIKLMLAETCWYHHEALTELSCRDGEDNYHFSEAVNLLQECTELTDVNCFDLKAQATLLTAEVHHALACLKLDETDEASDETPTHTPEMNSSKTLPSVGDGFSPSTPDNGNGIPPTALDAPPATPISGLGVLDTPRVVLHTKYQRGMLPKKSIASSFDSKDFKTESDSERSEGLMSTAYKCMEIWKEWSKEFGEELSDNVRKGSESAVFYWDRNMAFLQHVVCIALAHDKPVFALDCLHQAKEMATSAHRHEVEKNINNKLLSLLGQLGPIHVEANSMKGSSQSAGQRGSKAHFEEMKGLKVDQGDPASLVSSALYLFSTNKGKESTLVQKTALDYIESCREKEPLTPNLTFLLVELKCLIAKCSRLLELQALYSEEDMAVGHHPIHMAYEALKYVTSLKCFLDGKSDSFFYGRGKSFDSWHVIYIYLDTLHFGGRVFLQAGMTKVARTYLQEGLRTAQTCRLATRTAVFLTAMSDLSLSSMNSITEASKHLQNISKFVQPHPCLDETSEESSVVCGTESCDIDSVLLSLSSVSDASSQLSLLDLEKYEHSQWSTDYSPWLAKVRVHSLWVQAEICLRLDQPEFSKAIQHLLNARNIASNLPYHLDLQHFWVEDSPSTYFDTVNPLQYQLTTHKLLTVESTLRLAQVYFSRLSEMCRQLVGSHDKMTSADEGVWSKEDVAKHLNSLSALLETVLEEGKQLSFCYEGRVMVATAQLLKIHLMYLPMALKGRSLDDMGGESKEEQVDKDVKDEWEDCDDAAFVAREVKELKLEEEFWNTKRMQRMKMGNSSSNDCVPSASAAATTVSDSSPGRKETMEMDLSPQSITSSPTKRASMGSENETSVSPTPPKFPKADEKVIKALATPVSFFSTSNLKNKRGRVKTETRAKTSKSSLLGRMIKSVEENGGCDISEVAIISHQPNDSVRTARPKKETKVRNARGRRGDTNAAESDSGAGLCREEQCSGSEIVVDNKSGSIELSPITAQIAKLSIDKKSVSPKKRKSENELCLVAEEQEVDDKPQTCNVSKGRGKRTATKSSVISRRKCKVTNVEDKNERVENEPEIKIGEEETKKNMDGKNERKENEVLDTPQIKVNRKTRNASVRETQSTVTRKTRRTGKRAEKSEEDSPELERGTTSYNAAKMPATNLHIISVSPMRESFTDTDLGSDDSFSISINSPCLPVVDSPFSESPLVDRIYNLNNFSSPLRELHLNSPIEIPRGKPQRKEVAVEKRNHLARDNKKGRNVTSTHSPDEPPHEFDDDDDSDQENVSSPLSVKKKTGSLHSRGKLSLRKKTKTSNHVLCDSNSMDIEQNESEKKMKNEIKESDKNVVLAADCGNILQPIGRNSKQSKACVCGRRKGRTTSDEKLEGEGKDLIAENGIPTLENGHKSSDLFISAGTTLERGNEVEEEALESLRQLRAFPPSYIFNKLSKATALLLMYRSRHQGVSPNTQTQVAAHLSDSMHVTFQHMLTKNLISKLRVKKSSDKQQPVVQGSAASATVEKSKYSEWSTSEDWEELRRERVLMKEVLERSHLQWPVGEALMGKLETLPKGWTVVQMAVVNFDLQNLGPCEVLITRMSSHQPPLTVSIPADRWKHFECAKRLLEACVVHEVENMTPEKYWTYRYKNDCDMQNLIYFLQEKFLSGLKWLFVGHGGHLDRDKRMGSLLHQAAVHLASQLKDCGDDRMAVNHLECILELLLVANEKDIESLLLSIWPKNLSDLVKASVLKLQKEAWTLYKGEDGETGVEKGPVILILDKVFSQIPWESMPILRLEHITRVPSLTALQALLHLHQQRTDSVFQNGVGRENVITVIDPEMNLEGSVKFLKPQFEKFKGWKCQSQQALTVSALKDYLKQELYISLLLRGSFTLDQDIKSSSYSGHGWGRQFVAGDELQMIRAKAVAVIMGCNSGKMEFASRTDGHGAPLYFLLAGCPAVVGNLWVVTDKDIDKLTSHLVQSWMASKGQISLCALLNKARLVCKLVGLNGYAPVIYGLPINMN